MTRSSVILNLADTLAKAADAIEPIIGHCKVDARNWLHGKRSDQINAITSNLNWAIGFNRLVRFDE